MHKPFRCIVASIGSLSALPTNSGKRVCGGCRPVSAVVRAQDVHSPSCCCELAVASLQCAHRDRSSCSLEKVERVKESCWRHKAREQSSESATRASPAVTVAGDRPPLSYRSRVLSLSLASSPWSLHRLAASQCARARCAWMTGELVTGEPSERPQSSGAHHHRPQTHPRSSPACCWAASCCARYRARVSWSAASASKPVAYSSGRLLLVESLMSGPCVWIFGCARW